VPTGGATTIGPRTRPSRQSNTPFVEAMKSAFAIPELRRRLIFVFLMFSVYVVGLHVGIPWINHQALAAMFSQGKGGLLNLVDVFSGGALKSYSVFAMGIIPYINASIVMQLMTFAIPQLQERAKEGESGRKYIAQITRYLTVILSFVQGAGSTYLLYSRGIITGGLVEVIAIIITLAGGTAFLMWLAEQITEHGIGNGVSLIIFCGIMVRLPSQLFNVSKMVVGGEVKPWQVLLLVLCFFGTVVGIIFMQLGQRKIPIQHVRKIVGNRMQQGGTQYLPLRVTSAGVIPIIFALSIQLMPVTIGQMFFHDQAHGLGLFFRKWGDFMQPGGNPFSLSSLFYGMIIVGFTYFYTAVTVNTEQIADDMKKYGSYIPAIRPGKPTQEYLDRVMTRITLAGAIFLAFIALVNWWVPAWTNTGGANGFTLVGGTSLLIVVGVALDTMQAIEAQLLMRNYEGFIK
jgi:preprotein translocase subunit SecY